MTTKTCDSAVSGCLVLTALCPVATCCAPCLCAAANVIACDDDKHNIFKAVDHNPCQKLMIDEEEIEVFYQETWICTCGHIYEASADGNGKAFRDLPLEWPCPRCGQTHLCNWTLQNDCGEWPASECSDTHASLWSPRDRYGGGRFTHLSPSFDLSATLNTNIVPMAARSECSTLTAGCSSARSAGNCSEAFPSDCESDISWLDVYDGNDVDAMHSEGELASSRRSLDPEDGMPVFAECCCERGHTLTCKDGQLWCQMCAMSIQWPIWPRMSPQECKTPERTFDVSPEQHAIVSGIGGKFRRQGIGRQGDPVRPGLMAGQGTAGPWWTRTDPWFLGK